MKKILSLFIIVSLMVSQTWANGLFDVTKKTPKSLVIKKYTWNPSDFTMKETIQNVTDVSNKNGSYFANDALNYISNSNINDQKIVYEYEFTEHIDQKSINYKNENELTSQTGMNKYQKTINANPKNRNNTVDVLGNTHEKAIVVTSVSNYGQKGQTAAARSFLHEDGKRLIVQAEKVNYVDMLITDIENRCKNKLPIPKLMYSIVGVLSLANDTPNESLAGTPGIIDLEKEGSLCSKSRSQIGKIIMKTNLFYPNGDLKLFFKDQNWNKMVALSFTADALFQNNGTEAYLNFDKPSQNDVVEKKTKSKTMKLKQWFEFSTTTGSYKMMPISYYTEFSSLYGSYSLDDVSAQGTKIAGAWFQRANTIDGTVTPDGHSVNFLVTPTKEMSQDKSYALFQKSKVKKSWNIFLIVVIVVSLFTVGVIPSSIVAGVIIALILSHDGTKTSIKGIYNFSQTNHIITLITKPQYSRYLDKYIFPQTSIDLSDLNPNAFWGGQKTSSIFNNLNKNVGQGDSGTLVHATIGSIDLFNSGHRNSISQRATSGVTLQNNTFLRLKTNFNKQFKNVWGTIDHVFKFDSFDKTYNLNNSKNSGEEFSYSNENSKNNTSGEVEGSKINPEYELSF